MPSVIHIADKLTLSVLRSLFTGAYEVSTKKVQSKTNLGKSIIRNRLNYLFKNGIVTGIRPSLDVVKCGFNTQTISFMNLDLVNEEALTSLEKIALSDPYFFYFGDMSSYTGFNKYALQIYRRPADWDQHVNKSYWGGIDHFYELVRDRVLIHLPLDRLLKNVETGKCISQLLAENGHEVDDKLADPATIRILKALYEDVYEVSYKRIQSMTKMSKSVIHGRLEFLRNSGFIGRPSPKINALKCGFTCKVYTFLKFDKSRRSILEKMREQALKDPHIFRFGDVLEHNYNTCLFGIYRSDNEWQKSFKLYFDKVPGFYNAVTDRMSIIVPLNFVQKEKPISMAVLDIFESEKK